MAIINSVFTFFCFIFLCQSAYADTNSLSWLKFKPETLKNWNIDSDTENDPGVMYIRSSNTVSGKLLQKKIFMLLGKKSGSYQLAIETFLQVMSRHHIAAKITVFQFNKNIDRGRAALMRAEREGSDLVFSIGSESAALVNQYFQNKNIPVVTSTNKDPVQLGQVADYHTGSGHNIAYTSLNIPFDVQMNYLSVLRPKLKVIGLLYNKNHKQVMATEVIPVKNKLKQLGLDVVDIAVSSRSEAGQELQQRMPLAIAEMRMIDPQESNSVLWITSSTAVFNQIAIINQFADKIPVLGSIPNIVTEGEHSAVLAIGIDRRNNAQLASIYAVKILTGQAEAGELEVGIVTPPDIAINFLVAKKIALKIPFQFFESASFIYNYQGEPARMFGQKVP